MIEGLKITVGTEELQVLCRKQAEFHRERAMAYLEAHKQQMELKVEIGPGYSNSSNMDAAEKCKSKSIEHSGSAAELEFMADHLAPNETFLLDRSDLYKLGITKSNF